MARNTRNILPNCVRIYPQASCWVTPTPPAPRISRRISRRRVDTCWFGLCCGMSTACSTCACKIILTPTGSLSECCQTVSRWYRKLIWTFRHSDSLTPLPLYTRARGRAHKVVCVSECHSVRKYIYIIYINNLLSDSILTVSEVLSEWSLALNRILWGGVCAHGQA